MTGKDEQLYHGFTSPYHAAVDTILAADPKVLEAIHEVIFSAYCPYTCDTASSMCMNNKTKLFSLAKLLREGKHERNVA